MEELKRYSDIGDVPAHLIQGQLVTRVPGNECEEVSSHGRIEQQVEVVAVLVGAEELDNERMLRDLLYLYLTEDGGIVLLLLEQAAFVHHLERIVFFTVGDKLNVAEGALAEQRAHLQAAAISRFWRRVHRAARPWLYLGTGG